MYSSVTLMALSEAFANISSNYRFHLSVRGGTFLRLFYLTFYYFIFTVFRFGDRYLRALVWLKRLGLSDARVDVTTPEGLRLSMDLHTAYDPLYQIVGKKDYTLFGFEPKPGDTVVDVGANIGVYTTLAARRVGPEGTVVSVEPHPGNCAVLRENVSRNGLEQVHVVEAALDERVGRTKLYIHERAINHSIVRESGRSVEIDVTTVDKIVEEKNLSRFDVLKIDTEGNVVEILRGAAAAIRRFRPKITLEYEPGDVERGLDKLLDSYGYELKVHDAIGYASPRTNAPS
jgi:FkbM family methyltransferase